MIVNPPKAIWVKFGKSLITSLLIALIAIFFGYLASRYGQRDAKGIQLFIQLLPCILTIIVGLVYTNKKVIEFFRLVFINSWILPIAFSFVIAQLLFLGFIHLFMQFVLLSVNFYIGQISMGI